MAIDEKKLKKELAELHFDVPYSVHDDRWTPYTLALDRVIDLIKNQPKVNEWIPVEERLPEEYKAIDEETGYYRRSEEVLCFCEDYYNGTGYWIDYTIDGEWQTHEYIDGEKMYWMPLPKSPKKE